MNRFIRLKWYARTDRVVIGQVVRDGSVAAGLTSGHRVLGPSPINGEMHWLRRAQRVQHSRYPIAREGISDCERCGPVPETWANYRAAAGLATGGPIRTSEQHVGQDASRLMRRMSSSRLLMPSLVNRRYKCPSTVRTEMTSRSAICRLVSPAATSSTI